MIKKILTLFAGLIVSLVLLFAYIAARNLILWSPAEEVEFDSGDIVLAGTLIKPADNGPFPAVVILHGAGRDSRGGPGHRAKARAMRRAGFAVLLYDKRGTGASGGNFENFRYSDFAADAGAAVQYLTGRPDIDASQIGLFGASESGWFTPEVAVKCRCVAFIINQVGPPLSWVDTVLWEVRNDYLASGARESDLDTLLPLTRKRWDYFVAAGQDASLAGGPEREALEAEMQEAFNNLENAEQFMSPGLAPYDAASYAATAANIQYDPAPYLLEITIPVLYVFGEHDINVPTADSAAYLDRLRDEHGKDNIEYKILPDVGHSLASWKGLLNAGYTSGYLALVQSWAAAVVAMTR